MVPNTRIQEKVAEESQTVLDLRTTDARHRSSDMEKIIKEMEIGNEKSFQGNIKKEIEEGKKKFLFPGFSWEVD